MKNLHPTPETGHRFMVMVHVLIVAGLALAAIMVIGFVLDGRSEKRSFRRKKWRNRFPPPP